MALPEELANLPPPNLISAVDYDASLAQLRTRLVQIFNAAGIAYDVEDLETDPGQILLQVAAYHKVMLEVRINESIRSWFLAYAYGGDLDVLAQWYDVTRKSGETDDELKRRIIENIRGRSTGGTEPRYRAVALGVDGVADAAVYTVGRDPTIHVAVFAKTIDGIANQALLDAVNAALQDPKVRMVNDRIVVASAAREAVAVTANITLLPNAAANTIEVARANLIGAWAREMLLGRDPTRSWIISKLQVEGVQMVELVLPATEIVIPFNRAAALGTVTLNLTGRAY